MNTYRLIPAVLVVPVAACLWSCESGSAPANSDETEAMSTSGGTTTRMNGVSSSTTRATSTSSAGSDRSTSQGASDTDPGTETVATQSTTASTREGDTTRQSDSNAVTSDLTNATGDGSGGGTSTSGETTSSDAPHTTFAFVVSVGGVVRAFRMDPGAEPEQVADFQLEVTFGDFFIAANPSASRLFVSYNNTVMALAFDAQAQTLTELDTAATAGGGTHVEVSPNGEHVIVAHYNEGQATHVAFDGTKFGDPSQVSAGQNAHSTRIHASGSWAYVPCLGSNHVAQYTLGESLTANTPATVSVPGGPRHMTFHPNGEVAYVLTELTAQAYAFAVNSDGTLGPEPLDREDVVTDVAQPSGSDVQITPDGKHLYTFERRTQNLYHFDIASDGTLTASLEPTNFGQEVRAFAISPSGDVLLGGGGGGVLYTYAINPTTGALTAVGQGLQNLQSIQATVIRDVPEAP